MSTTLTIKGQITIPKQIRDALDLQPGCKLNFTFNDAGEVLLQKEELGNKNSKNKRTMSSVKKDRFEQVRGRAYIQWRTKDLMKLLRGV
jgi:AbrB family looped-hinge helix DNA binding protein